MKSGHLLVNGLVAALVSFASAWSLPAAQVVLDPNNPSWSPKVTVKGGMSGFYTIRVMK